MESIQQFKSLQENPRFTSSCVRRFGGKPIVFQLSRFETQVQIFL